MLKRIDAAWATANSSDCHAKCRFYIDPRGLEYPVYSGTPSYYEVSGTYNKPGYYALSSTLVYLFIPSTTSISGEVLYENIMGSGTESKLIELYGGYSITLKQTVANTYSLTAVGATSVTITGGVGQPQQRIGFSLTYGGNMELYVNGASVATGTAPALTTSPTYLRVNGSANCYVSYMRIFDGYAASDADFLSNWDHVGNEEIFFHFNKTAYGRTRCNIDRSGYHVVTGFNIKKQIGYRAGSASLMLNNLSGEFSDDQYATYAPGSGSYNGTASQRYLTGKIGLEIETWGPTASSALYPSTSLYPSTTLYPSEELSDTFETTFRGWVAPGGFARSTTVAGISTVAISAEDGIAEIAKRVVRTSRKWEDYYLSRETPSSNSLFHAIAELATKREVYNYLTNASFEGTTISDSWVTDGTLTKDTTTVLDGTYCGKFSGTTKQAYQIINMNDLSYGETFTASIYIYATSALGGTFYLQEKTGSTINGSTSSTITHAGKGWQRFSVSHTITNSSSTALAFVIVQSGTWTNVPMDCAMLKYGNRIEWWAPNTHSGTPYSAAGVSAVDSEMLSSFDWIGIDADDITYQHPWAWLNQGESVWSNMKQIADACIARILCIDSSGVLRFRSAMANPTISASLGIISQIRAISSGQQNIQANKITVKGVKIVERTNVETVWEAKSSGLPSDADKPPFYRSLSPSETIPNTSQDDATVFEAIYGTVSKES